MLDGGRLDDYDRVHVDRIKMDRADVQLSGSAVLSFGVHGNEPTCLEWQHLVSARLCAAPSCAYTYAGANLPERNASGGLGCP
jgi:hypothetical protein